MTTKFKSKPIIRARSSRSTPRLAKRVATENIKAEGVELGGRLVLSLQFFRKERADLAANITRLREDIPQNFYPICEPEKLLLEVQSKIWIIRNVSQLRNLEELGPSNWVKVSRQMQEMVSLGFQMKRFSLAFSIYFQIMELLDHIMRLKIGGEKAGPFMAEIVQQALLFNDPDPLRALQGLEQKVLSYIDEHTEIKISLPPKVTWEKTIN